MCSACSSAAEPGSGRAIAGRKRRAKSSNGSPTRQAARLSARVEVVEHAQQASTVHRVGRKRVDVQARVVLAPAGLAALDADRPIRRVAGLQAAAVVREQPFGQRRRLRAVALDHPPQRVGVGAAAPRTSSFGPRRLMFLALPSATPGSSSRRSSAVSSKRRFGKHRMPPCSTTLSTPCVGVRSPFVTPVAVLADLEDVAHQRTRMPGMAPGHGSST